MPLNRQSGFTLLEVMVAFVIAALATVALLAAGFHGAAGNRAAASDQEAVSRAQSRLASIGVLTALHPEQLAGDDGGGYSWRLAVTALQSSGRLTLYAVSVTEQIGARSVRLDTERAGPGS